MTSPTMSFKRRDFLKSALATSVLLPAVPMLAGSCSPKSNTAADSKLTEKVTTAMLSMQRASWEQGVALQALLESGNTRLALLLAREAVLRQSDEGRLAVLYSDNGVTDPAASGEAVFVLGKTNNDPQLNAAHKKMLNYLLNKAPKTPEGILHHTLNSPEIWIDSMYMAPPYLCVAGHAEEAIKQVEGIRNYLWNEKEQLYSHRYHVAEQRFIIEKFWGVGNGWAIAALARIIDQLPESMSSERKRMIGYAKQNIDGCLKYLRPDGLFHDIVDDPGSFIETNLSQMIAYGLFCGLKSKWLSEDYLDAALQMRKAAHAKVDEWGYVQDVCGAPWFDTPGRATEGQAFFLLMEAAFQKYSSNKYS
ncbi:glycoside hydrolase family 88 protein [Roseimarinus sediminis]|uniref:glycoside hydrolase family 88 protein n=1 Tax=Roseimarinus sediminis TaxID=1610899 RepID=UPI003D238CBC